MNTYVEIDCSTRGDGTGLHCRQRTDTELDIGKKKWLEKYSRGLHELWLQWQTPLGIACAYAEQIKEDLTEIYDDPLKRMFIETTYN